MTHRLNRLVLAAAVTTAAVSVLAAAPAMSAVGQPVALAAASGARPSTPRCGNTDTAVWMALINAAGAGHFEEVLEFTNVSNRACHLFGFPGVFALNASFRQVGPPAARGLEMPQTVTLQKHQTAHAELLFTVTGFIDGCKTASVAALNVFPPNTTQDQIVIHFRASACKNKIYMQISPVLPGLGLRLGRPV